MVPLKHSLEAEAILSIDDDSLDTPGFYVLDQSLKVRALVCFMSTTMVEVELIDHDGMAL
jgi:hypothetical protein